MSNKVLLLAIFCAFFINIGANYASNVNYNINNTIFDKVENVNKNIENDSNNLAEDKSKSFNLSNNLVGEDKPLVISNNLAAGENKPSRLSQNSITNASFNIIRHISKNGKLPNFAEISAYKFSMPEYLYLASKTIQHQHKKNDAEIKVKYNVKNPKKPTGTNVKLKISSNSYFKHATRVANFISKHSTAPNFLKLGSSKIQYQTLIYAFAEALTWSKANGNKLPSSISINVKKTSKLNKYLPRYTTASKDKTVSSKRLNMDYDGESLEQYLSSSKNCQVNDKEIRSLSDQITKRHKSTYDKAKAIYDWVKDKISYRFYYNTKYGAKKTINKKIGNCVDQSHLIIALSRAAGIAARYVHGRCDFLSGNTYGHVWAQVKVGNTWYVADSTSSRNRFGVINNWDASSYRLNGIHASLKF